MIPEILVGVGVAAVGIYIILPKQKKEDKMVKKDDGLLTRDLQGIPMPPSPPGFISNKYAIVEEPKKIDQSYNNDLDMVNMNLKEIVSLLQVIAQNQTLLYNKLK